jgi:hypothetical protein
MKVWIFLIVLLTLGAIVWSYQKEKNLQKLLLSLGSFLLIVALGIAGSITMLIVPIFLTHWVLVLFAWGGLWLYIVRGKYYWWVICSPLFTLGIFLLLAFLEGSADT